MSDIQEIASSSKMIASLITELDKPNGLYTWLVLYGETNSLTRYVALSRTFCQEKRPLPNLMPSVLEKLVTTQENLTSLFDLWCCFWNTYERIQDNELWLNSVERHPSLIQFNNSMRPGLRFTSVAWKIAIKIRSKHPTLDPWLLSLAAFSLILRAMKSHSASYEQWNRLCDTHFENSVDDYLVEKLYGSNCRCWQAPLDPPQEFTPERITSFVAKFIVTHIFAAKGSHDKGEPSLAHNITQWLDKYENNTENLNPMILMSEYIKFLKTRKGLNPFVFLAKPSDDLVQETTTDFVASASQEPPKEMRASQGTDVRDGSKEINTSTSPQPRDEEGWDKDANGIASDKDSVDDAFIQHENDDADEVSTTSKPTPQNDDQVEGASRLIAMLITEVDKPNGLYTWLLQFGEQYSLTDFVALSTTFCKEKSPLQDSTPVLLKSLVETQKNLDSLHHLWCCFWNTCYRIQDDPLWNEAVESHPMLTYLEKTSSAGMMFVTVAWKIAAKLRQKDSTLDPWILSLAAISLLLKAMNSHPLNYQKWVEFCSARFGESYDAYLLGKLYQSDNRCREYPLDPPSGFAPDLVSSLVKTVITTQIYNDHTSVRPLAETIREWLEHRENRWENLDPTTLMTEYVKFIRNGKGLNPFVFLAKSSDIFLSQRRKSGRQLLLPVARTGLEASILKEHQTERRGTNASPTRKEPETSDEATTNDVALNHEADDDVSVQQNDENENTNGSIGKHPASDAEDEANEVKKRKLNLNASRSQRLATAMALVVKELSKMNQGLPDSAAQTYVLSDSMELNEWTVSLLIVDHVAPSSRLVRYLDEASPRQWTKELIPILNRALLRFSQENLVEKATRTAPVSVSKSDGVVQIHGSVTDDKIMSKAVILLYYHALEAILTSESERLKVTSHPQIVMYSVFHKALLACCMWCVTKAIGATQKLRSSPCLQALSIQSTLRVCDSNPYDFLKVSESFLRVLCLGTSNLKLGSPLPQKLPRLLHRDLQSMEVTILDSLLWSTSILNGTAGSLPEQIEDFMGKSNENVTLWPPEILAPTLREEASESGKNLTYPTPDHEDFAEYRCVNFLIRSVVKLSFSRFEDICGLLKVPVQYPLVTHAWVAFRHLLRHHVEMLFDRHVDQWILCCLYGVAKVLSFPLTFAEIIEAYIKSRGPVVGDVTCQHILRYIRMDNTSHDLTTGDVIALYNHVWVPNMKTYLMESASLRESAKKVQELLRGKEAATPDEPINEQ
ncbi:retinoblastoma-associated protein [Fistulifera solaris]|uniref:Retinoblastoma-associated protein n=1 Tax=Fistulifera solaris TaxID=1519565 RepID=A0A1Z5KB73_FISSO|nr:retinoblastoma-associated protein [Fistulifera solaris]|eukprot:GAX23341.1 retinoblastoma-associated protein [Fistulifera solaris]